MEVCGFVKGDRCDGGRLLRCRHDWQVVVRSVGQMRHGNGGGLRRRVVVVAGHGGHGRVGVLVGGRLVVVVRHVGVGRGGGGAGLVGEVGHGSVDNGRGGPRVHRSRRHRQRDRHGRLMLLVVFRGPGAHWLLLLRLLLLPLRCRDSILGGR